MQKSDFKQSLLVTHYEDTPFELLEPTTARRGRSSSTDGSASRRPRAAPTTRT